MFVGHSGVILRLQVKIKVEGSLFMKQILLFAFITTFSLGTLIGCSNETEPQEKLGEDHSTAENVELTLWLDNDDYADTLIAALEEVLPHVSFSYEHVGSVDALDKIALDGPAGLGGDVMLLAHDHMADGVNQNLLLPLGANLSSLIEERIMDTALGTVNHDDTYFGVPLTTESVALFYNKTLLEELDLEVATTFEEIIEQAEVFNSVRDNQFIIRFEAGNSYHSHFFLTAAGFELFGPNHDDGEAVNLNTPEVVTGLKFFEQVKEILPVPAGDLDWDSTHGSFVNGEVPYLISGPWSIPDIHEDGEFEWGVTKIPSIGGVQPTTFSGHTIAVISSFTEHPDVAREVIDFIASDEGLQIMYDIRGSIPALVDVSAIDGLSDDPYMLGILAQAENAHPMPTIPEMQSYWQAAEAMYRAVWEGLLTPEEAAEKAESDFNAAISMQQ